MTASTDGSDEEVLGLRRQDHIGVAAAHEVERLRPRVASPDEVCRSQLAENARVVRSPVPEADNADANHSAPPMVAGDSRVARRPMPGHPDNPTRDDGDRPACGRSASSRRSTSRERSAACSHGSRPVRSSKSSSSTTGRATGRRRRREPVARMSSRTRRGVASAQRSGPASTTPSSKASTRWS